MSCAKPNSSNKLSVNQVFAGVSEVETEWQSFDHAAPVWLVPSHLVQVQRFHKLTQQCVKPANAGLLLTVGGGVGGRELLDRVVAVCDGLEDGVGLQLEVEEHADELYPLCTTQGIRVRSGPANSTNDL